MVEGDWDNSWEDELECGEVFAFLTDPVLIARDCMGKGESVSELVEHVMVWSGAAVSFLRFFDEHSSDAGLDGWRSCGCEVSKTVWVGFAKIVKDTKSGVTVADALVVEGRSPREGISIDEAYDDAVVIIEGGEGGGC